jgi:hypothetical protein
MDEKLLIYACSSGRPPRMQQFTGLDRPHILGSHGHKGHGLAGTVHEFHFVASAIFVNIHNRTHIATNKFFVQRVTIKHDK